MKLKSILAVAVVAACSFAGSAQASLVWTVSGTGTITSGTDTTGVFGTKNSDLSGLGYTQTITASVDPTQYNKRIDRVDFVELYVPNSSTVFTETVTVNGYTTTFNIVIGGGQFQYVEDGKSSQSGSSDEIYTGDAGWDAAHNYVSSSIHVYSNSVAFVPSLDFSQTITQPVKDGIYGYSSFSVSGSDFAKFDGTLKSLSVNANATNVPEPTSIALLGLGLLGMTTLRRRKSK